MSRVGPALTFGLLVLGGLAAAPLTVAGRLPDWAEVIAENAPEISSDISEHGSRVLLSETVIEIQSDGTLHLRQRRAAQALSSDAAEVGLGYFRFNDLTTISRTRAWHLPTEGKAKKTRGRQALDLAIDDSFLSDEKARLLAVDGIQRGSLVFFEFEAEERPYDLAYPVIFQEDVPALLMRARVEAPEGWAVNHVWLTGEDVAPTVEGNAYTWELQRLPAPDFEPLGVSPGQSAPYLLLGFDPPQGAALDVRAFRDWRDVASWFEALAEGRDAVTPEIEAAAAEAFGESDAGVVSRAREAGTWVRDRVRYVAIELGVGGYQPRPAAQVLEKLYGDCKDKATLLRAILDSAGVESYPILIHATHRDTVSSEIPALAAFNHMVLGVALPEDVTVPDEVAAAVVDAGDLGRLFIVDVTDETTSVGHLSAQLAGKTALVVTGVRSRLLDLPLEPSAHRVEKVMEAQIANDMAVVASLSTSLYGQPASRWRAIYRNSQRDYREQTESELRDRWPGVKLEKLEIIEEAGDGAFVELVEVLIPPPINPGAPNLFRIFPGALDQFPRVTLTRRETAVHYPHPLTVRYKTTLRGAGAEWGLPRDEERDGDGWLARSEVRREDDVLRGSFEFELKRQHFEADAFRDLRRLWSGARKASSPAVAFNKSDGD